MKKTVFTAAILFVTLVLIVVTRTFLFTLPPIPAAQPSDLKIDPEKTASCLSKALTFKTVSHQDPNQFDNEPFISFHRYLEKTFPLIHAALQKETINSLSLLYTWKGTDTTLKPILLYAHQDVVPVAPGTEKEWDHPPYDGIVSDGFIWGRGALDDKSSMVGILEAVEYLLQNGFQPRRSLLLAFGHDEEVSGTRGAHGIAELLASRNIQLEFILDEGAVIVKDVVPGVTVPIALIGIAEKGYVSLELSVKTTGGHSSMPPEHTAIGILSKAITIIEENPFPATLKYSAQFFEHVGPKMPFARKMIFANMWLFNPLVKKILSGSPELNAGIRTTAAATLFNGGVKENVLPTQASAVINFRILPGETVSSTIEYIRKIIGNPDIQIKPIGPGNDPSRIEDTRSKSYEMIQNTIYSLFSHQELVVAPFLVLAATDSHHFAALTNNTYRFSPIVYHPEDLKRPHGTNERISVGDYVNTVRFYYEFIRRFDTL